jgi:hypothetical protein
LLHSQLANKRLLQTFHLYLHRFGETPFMKKATLIIAALGVFALVMSSCRTTKQPCAAYSKAQTVEKKDIPG